MKINVYGDETCHLRNDGVDLMVFGAIWCEESKVNQISNEIKNIKIKNGLSKWQELKWNKVSKSNVNLYKEIVNYFFIEDDLNFRAYIILDKKRFTSKSKSEYDLFYYKCYFQMLQNILSKDRKFNIFLDIKDTRSAFRNRKLHEVLENNSQRFNYSSKRIIDKFQNIRSFESQLMQVTDIIIGAIGYGLRDIKTNPAKLELIELIKQRAGTDFKSSSLYRDNKFNLFINDGYEGKCDR